MGGHNSRCVAKRWIERTFAHKASHSRLSFLQTTHESAEIVFGDGGDAHDPRDHEANGPSVLRGNRGRSIVNSERKSMGNKTTGELKSDEQCGRACSRCAVTPRRALFGLLCVMYIYIYTASGPIRPPVPGWALHLTTLRPLAVAIFKPRLGITANRFTSICLQQMGSVGCVGSQRRRLRSTRCVPAGAQAAVHACRRKARPQMPPFHLMKRFPAAGPAVVGFLQS